ncbi:DNA primase [bacterium (Candidatus Torokbacteria) CG_4_10_14_0_2_um_filter_35_8]|nr:MAG: DNA primase [bacterium (Candidatus Torokbacteria) CG_4_10_14_0_2_um_filter_35_8]
MNTISGIKPSEQIKERLNIVDIIREYVPSLKSTGANFKALCPFHNEKTPSFIVSPEKQIWHCFGCGKGGDIFNFVMEIEGIEFVDALRLLADKAGIKLATYDKKLDSKRNRILEVLEEAQDYFHKSLFTFKAKQALDYLLKRKISKKTIAEFKLGYAFDEWHSLESFLKGKDFSAQDIFDSGLLVKDSSGRIYDRFRKRVMFPITNVHGQVIGFGGRILETSSSDKEQAKYVNTPQTLVYDKSRTLYALDKAKQEIRKKRFIVVTEGYMDTISSHQAGIKNVIASSGTAFTLDQINLIKRYTKNLALAFDIDIAGDTATKRSIDLALSSGMNAKVVLLPKGKDPDECIRTDPKIWVKAINSKVPVMEYYFKTTLKDFDAANIEQKKRVAARLLPIISRIFDPIEKEHYLKKLSEEIQVEVSTLKEALEKYPSARTYSYPSRDRSRKRLSEEETEQNRRIKQALDLLFALCLNFPENIPFLISEIESPNMIPLSSYRNLYTLIRLFYNKKEKFDLPEFQACLSKKFPKINQKIDLLLLKTSQAKNKSEDDAKKEIQALAKRFKVFYYKKKLKELEFSLKEKEKEVSRAKKAETRQLLSEFSKISKKLDVILRE